MEEEVQEDLDLFKDGSSRQNWKIKELRAVGEKRMWEREVEVKYYKIKVEYVRE